jgi:hypothetical protein
LSLSFARLNAESPSRRDHKENIQFFPASRRPGV